MESNKRTFFKNRVSNQFKRKGVNRKGGSNTSFGHEQSSESSQPAETVYRILCPSHKIGGVIGRGGSIVKALREETQAKITVADSVPGSDERVIIIYSSSTKVLRKENNEEEHEMMKPHCAAQNALLKVHDSIIKEDLFGDMASGDDKEDTVVTARLLVPNNMVGCVLGRRGDVIQKLRSETGASIRVLPAEHLPACAMDTDELLQVSGKPELAKRALYEVSTLLHQNPRKDNPPLGFSMPRGSQGFHPSGPPMANMLPPGNPMWNHGNSSSHGRPPMRWNEEFGDRPSRAGSGGFNDVPLGQVGEAPVEFSMKILCPAAKIGGVIGKGGLNVRQLQQETGAAIHVEDASTDSDERVIRVSALEPQWNPRSQTIDAILQLQKQTSDLSEKAVIATRVLIPSSKVGCILGQGGHVINEMRRRTQADIRVYCKDDKPKCASEDEELVQISGSFGVAREALAEISTRLRERTMRDISTGVEPRRSLHELVTSGSVAGKGPPSPRKMRIGSTGGYEPHMREREYEPQTYPARSAATGYPHMNSTSGARLVNREVGSLMAAGGSNERSMDEAYVSPGGQNMNIQQGSYQNSNRQRSSHQHMNVQQSSYGNTHAHQTPYQNMNAQQDPIPNTNQQSSYYPDTLYGSYPSNSQQSSYQKNTQQSSYPIFSQQGSYPMTTQKSSYPIYPQQGSDVINMPQSSYPVHSQQASYSMNTQQTPYPINTQQSSYPFTTQEGSYPVDIQQGAYAQSSLHQISEQGTANGVVTKTHQ